MNLIEKYATAAGVVLPKEPAKFPVNYHPVVGDYVTIAVKTGQAMKNYSHWPEVVRMIQPTLLKAGLWVVQLGAAGEEPLRGCVIKTGISLRESAFLVQSSKLHIAGDSCLTHFAGMVKTPVLSLYGSTLPEAVGPYYHGRWEFLRAADTELPSYQAEGEENPQIDFIKPEDVANKVFEMLGLKKKITTTTVKFGRLYHRDQVSFIPDHVPDFSKLGSVQMVVRMDAFHNEELVAELLGKRLRPCLILADEPLSAPLLEVGREKISRVVLRLKEGYSREGLENLRHSGVPYSLVWRGGEETLAAAKLDLFDFDPLQTEVIEKFDGVTPETCFRARHAFLGRGKRYASMWHYRMGVEKMEGPIGKSAFDCSDFWAASQGCYFYTL